MRHEEHFDVIVVGAGPAGIFAARELVGKRTVLVIDAGRELASKRCSVQSGGSCANCRPVCSVLGGFGGSQFFLGTKLSRYPAGRRLLEFVASEEELLALYDRIDDVLVQYGKQPREWPSTQQIDAVASTFARSGLAFKYYNAQKVSRSEMRSIGQGLYESLLRNGVRIHLGEVVQLVEKRDSGFVVTCDKGIYTCRNVVLAMGRLGSRRMLEMAKRLGILYREADSGTTIELGVRVETPYEVFSSIDNIHNDLKLKRSVGIGEDVRTFCLDYRGRLIRCVYKIGGESETSSIDGYLDGVGDECAERSRHAHLGIHHRFRLNGDLVRAYELVSRMCCDGKPVVQSLGGFLCGDDVAVVSPQMRDVTCGRLDRLLPQDTVRHIRSFIVTLDEVIPGFADRNNVVYAPSFEMGWARMEIDRGFQSNIPGCYLIGDISGHFRGALQAMVSGILGAQAILRDGRTTSTASRGISASSTG